MKTRIVMPDELALTWNRYCDLVQRGLDHGCGETSLAEYLKRLMSFQAQLWEISTDEGVLRGVCLTQFIDYQSHKTLHIVACAGANFEEWAHLHAAIEQFGIKNKAVAVEQWGRPGWAKVLPKLIPGYRSVYQVMRKDLPTGVTQIG
jgi:hypothetical protein